MSTRGRHRLQVGIVAGAGALILGAGYAYRAAPDASAREPEPLRVVLPGRNAEIESRALDLVRDASRGAAANGRGGLARLYAAPRVVGLTQPQRNVVIAAVTDRVVRAGSPLVVYTVVTLVNGSEGYRATSSMTGCDRYGRGLVFSVATPDTPTLVVLGAKEVTTVNAGSRIRVAPGDAVMQAWTDPRLDDHDESVTAIGEDESTQSLCPDA